MPDEEGPLGAGTLELLRELSHRLRTPLGTIYGYADLLAEMGDELAPGQAETWARRILNEVERATELLTDLSRLRVAVTGAFEPETLDLAAITAASVQRAGREADRPVAVEAPVPVVVRGDGTLLERAIFHLTLEALHLGRTASVRVASLDETLANVEVRWEPPMASQETHDPWQTLALVVARAHGGTLERGPGWARLNLPR